VCSVVVMWVASLSHSNECLPLIDQQTLTLTLPL
jgi:hypothetical protein